MTVSLHNQSMRLEQLKRFQGSMLDHTSSVPRDPEKTKFKFKEKYIFLSVCSSDDLKEAEKLLEEGVDINTSNVDGLTALHQSCLNQKVDVVKFLVEHSADVNTRDNDGWTPLHAACSTDNIEIASYLINNGSELDAVSFDGELPVDVTEDEAMIHFLSDAMTKHGIDSEIARGQEEKTMKEDAEHWLNTDSYNNRHVHPLSGASPLHVAAARGYVDIMQILLKAGANANAQDCDGWTPIHAAAHWGHKEACQLLVDNLCDLSIPNSSGLLAQDVADPELGDLIEELKEKQMYNDQILRRRTLISRRSRSSVSRLSFDQKQMMVQKSRGEERATMEMMLAKRNSSVSVFDVDEEKEEEMAEEVEEEEEEGSIKDAENHEIMHNDASVEEESENSADAEQRVESEESVEDELFLSDADEETESIPEIDFAMESRKKSELKKVETENLTAESSAEKLEQQNRINDSKTAHAIGRLEDEARSNVVTSEAKPPEVSHDATLESLVLASGSLLSSATTAALRDLANSHMWSMDDPKKDEEKENARRSRVNQIRKEKLEKRRSTQGVLKEDLSKAEVFLLQAAKCAVVEEELSDTQTFSDVENKEVNKKKTGIERHSVPAAKDISKEDLLLTTRHFSSSNNRNEDTALKVYRKNAPHEATIPNEEARARRKGRLSARPMRQENFEEMTPEKENQGKSSANPSEAKSDERNQIAAESLDRLSSHENTSVNSSLPLSTLQLPSSTADVCHHTCLENDHIDYKKLYEKEHSLNETLSLQNKHLQRQLNDATLQLENFQEVNRSIAKEKHDLERRISELEAEFQDAEELKSNNQRLKMDNAALVRVIGHLSKQTNP